MTTIKSQFRDADPKKQRSAEGFAILSLDLVRPVYPCLELTPLGWDTFQPVLRRAILKNREDFARDTTNIPDIQSQTIGLVKLELGIESAKAVQNWIGSTFISGPDDFRRHAYLKDILETASAWPELAIPKRLRTQFAEVLGQRSSRTCFDASYPDDDRDLTDWDAEIFQRMRFYDEFRNPYDFLHLTCGWIDFRRALAWFVRNSSTEEHFALTESVRIIGRETQSPARIYEFIPLEKLV